MKIEEYLNSKTRKIHIITIIGFTIFATGVVLATQSKETFNILAIIGFPIAFAGIAYQIFGVKCPRCQSAIGQNYEKGKMKFCSNCGVSFGDEM